MEPHQPNNPPEPFFNLFETLGAGPRGSEHTDWSNGHQADLSDPDFLSFRAHRVAPYDGSIRYADQQIGRLVEELRRRELLNAFLLIITSDHGKELWDHASVQQAWGDDPRGIWGVGHGHTMFQEVLHVPLIIRGPGWRPVGRVGCPVSLLDVAPTALSGPGLRPRESMSGQDLWPLQAQWPLPIEGHSGTPSCMDRRLMASSPAYGPTSGALLMSPLELSWRGDRVALYDLSTDPGEMRDLSAQHPDLVARMLAERAEVQHEPTMVPRGRAEELNPETVEQLRSLGYLP